MSKVAKAFRLDPVAVGHLEELQKATGSTQASIIEQSLAIYHALLRGGLSGPRRMLASTLPPSTPELGLEPAKAPTARPKRDKPARTTEQPSKPVEPALKPKTVKVRGTVYSFSFAAADLPAKGSAPCPCGSGRIFAKCHSLDFKKALKAGITSRG